MLKDVASQIEFSDLLQRHNYFQIFRAINEEKKIVHLLFPKS